MKKRTTAVCMILSALITMILSACQPTPEKPIVNAGDDTVLNDKIEATAIPTPEEKEENLSSIYNFPTSYKDSFECIDTSVKFDVNAEINVPDVKAAPALKIEAVPVQPEFIKTFAEKMHPGVTFYENLSWAIKTKSEIQKIITDYEEELSIPYEEFAKNYAEATGITDEESAQYDYQQRKYALEEYKKLLADAPETVEYPPADFTYHKTDYYIFDMPEFHFDEIYYGIEPEPDNGRRYMYLTATTDDGFDVTLNADSRFENDIYGTLTYYITPKGVKHNDDSSPFYHYKMNLSETEITEKCEKVLEAMGLEDQMIPVEIIYSYDDGVSTKPQEGKTAEAYYVEYHRGFSGLQVNNVELSNDYNYVNQNETINITIHHDMVTDVEYKNPYVITEVENENVELLPFDDIYAAFKKQTAVEFTKSYLAGGYFAPDADYDDVIGGAVQVKRINFGIVRIPIKSGGFRFVPGWQFEGSFDVFYNDGDKEHNGEMVRYVFMTINAVDGTRIAGMQ